MVKACSASRFALLDDGQQELVVENGNNGDRAGSGMDEQAGKFIPFIAVKYAVADRFPEAAEEMHDNLSRRTELVTVCIAEVTSERDCEVGVGLEACHDQSAVLV